MEPTNEEIRRTLAEFMGWTEVEDDWSWGEWTMYGTNGQKRERVLDYPADLNAMHRVEAKLHADDLHRDYVDALYAGVLHPWQQTDEGFYPDTATGEAECDFRLLHATAEQRARAAYRVIREMEGSKGE